MANTMIVVTGTSATGKTILSKKLASKFNLSLINKDEIKELLFDCLGIRDEVWAIQLGVTSFELSYLFAEKLCQTNKSFIIEGNFEDKYATKVFDNLKNKYAYKIVQLYCHAPEEILYDRYLKRDNSGERHRGHIINISGFDEFKNRVTNKTFKLQIDDCINIDVDTTKFENIELQNIYDEIYNILDC
ncbi:AAA family ATPase [Clostridium sp.]|uniref:AAA family ATPase n=1 Tax=Clostridium sp. TaxID=1506 RepID=UPI00321645D7